MQKLIISNDTKKAHKRYSKFIQEILEHIVLGNELYLSAKNKKPIKLFKTDLKYFSELLKLFKKTNFLLAKPQKLRQLIDDEEKIWKIVRWKKRPKKINNILRRIFEYENGFSKGKFIYLEKGNRNIIKHSRNPPDKGSKWGAVEYIKSLNVKYCIYCNEASLYHSLTPYKHSALDHFYNKDSYPFLALTLTNLIPSCTQCNTSIKNTREIPENALNPYEGSFHTSVQFSLEKRAETEAEMLKTLKKIRERDYSIDNLHVEKIQDAEFAENAKALADFFYIEYRYKQIEDLKKQIPKIINHNKFHNEEIYKRLPQLRKAEKKDFPEFYYNKSKINLYRFAKLYIDLCKEFGIRN